MANINKAAVLNPFTDLTANILEYVPRATTSEFGIVAIGSGINVDALGRIYLDTQEYSDRLTAIDAHVASSLTTQQTEVAAAIAQVNLTQSQTITALSLEVSNLRTDLTNSITATQTDLINRADQLAQDVTDITVQLTQDKATFTQEIQDALDYLKDDASVASALRTPRKIQGVDFDGTQDISLPTFTSETDGLVPKRIGATADNYLREDGTWVVPTDTTYALLTKASAEEGTATTANTISAQVLKEAIQYHAPTVTNIIGNAGTATKLQTARTVSFSGEATGSFSFDGSGNSSCVLALTNSGVAANTYGTALKIPTITVNAKGLITGVSEKEITKVSLGLERFAQNSGLNTAIAAPTVDAAITIDDNGWGIYRNPDLVGFDQALPIACGGTGATSIAAAKTNLNINRFVQDQYVTSMYAPTTDSRIVVTDNGWGVWSVSPSFNSALPLTSGGTGRTDGKAQALVNPRTVFGQTFDGSSDVGGTITATTGLVRSAENHFIDMGRGGFDRMNFHVWSGVFNFIDSQYGNVVARITQNGIDCNAATATRLQTARTINGVAFDGTANITIADNTKLSLAGGSLSGRLTSPSILMDKANNHASGISWYSSTYTSWQDYMAQAGTTSNGVLGNLTAPSGVLVTSWGRRSVIEPVASYGWTFETVNLSDTTPTVVAEISATGQSRWSGAMTVVGNITATGNVTGYSDSRIKDNISVIDDALNKVSKLKGVTFNRTDMDDKDKRYVGLIAQDVQTVMPEAVNINNDEINTLSVDYQGLIGLLVESIKELKLEIDELKEKVK